MKDRLTAICLVAAALTVLMPLPARAADPTNAVPARPSREEWQKMTMEERQAKMRELQAQRPDATAREEMQKLREEIRNLPPAERQAKIDEFQRKFGPSLSPEMEKRREELSKLSPEERRAKIEEWRKQNRPAATPQNTNAEYRRALIQQRLELLRAKKADGTITPQESLVLERFERAMQSPPQTPAPPKEAKP